MESGCGRVVKHRIHESGILTQGSTKGYFLRETRRDIYEKGSVKREFRVNGYF